MLADPELLQGIAHADQEAIRVRFADVAAGLFDVLRAGEEPVAVPDDRVPRKCLGQCLGSARRHGVGAADEVDTQRQRRACEEVGMKSVPLRFSWNGTI